MTVSLQNPADVVNAALVAIGWKNQVGSLRDGSEAAQLAIAIYGQERDDLLRSEDWGFAERMETLTVLKTAPATYVPPTTWDPGQYPPLNWRFEYAYPDGCLKVRSLRPTPLFIPNFDPSPNVFDIHNDSSFDPARRVILSNLADAVCVFTGRVTDPTTWAVDFASALVSKLGEKLGPALSNLDATKLEAVEAQVGKHEAAMEQG